MMRRFKQLFLYILLVTALLSVFYLCLFIGSVRIASTDVRAILRCLFAGGTPPDKNLYNLLVYVRMPRLVLNMLAGAVLSMAGILMQTLTHNPLAEPYVLGVSSGASTGAAGAIVFHWFSFLQGGRVFFSAFVCSFLAIAIDIKANDSINKSGPIMQLHFGRPCRRRRRCYAWLGSLGRI